MRRHTVLPILGSIPLYVCCLALALLQACQPGGPASPFKRYLSQFSLALSLPPLAPGFTPVPSLPEASGIAPILTPGNIDTPDFMLLSGCAVQSNISKRSTSLGQFAKPSQRLLLELEYLQLAPACISRLRDRSRTVLAARLEAAHLQKQAQLPILIFNATLGSDEYRSLWLSAPEPGGYPRSKSSAMVAALESINSLAERWLTGDYSAHNRELELLLSEVAGGDGGASLYRWSRQIDWLAAADRMLQQGLATRTLCLEQTRDRTLQQTATAASYFTRVLHPLIEQSQRRYLESTAPIHQLEIQLGQVLPPLYRQWMTARHEHISTLATAPGKHLELLQHFLQICDKE